MNNNFWQTIMILIGRLFGRLLGVSPVRPTSTSLPSVEPVTRNLLLIVYDPPVPSEGGKPLHQVMGWRDPVSLAHNHIRDLNEASYGYVSYQIAQRIEVDSFPVKIDGFIYNADEFVTAYRDGGPFHEPDAVDYMALLREHQIIEKINAGVIDEVWMMGMPYAGYYESVMAGPDAFFCNAPPLKNTDHAHRRFIIMGFNYERGNGEMLEAFNHRVESIMKRVYSSRPDIHNFWEQFIRYDQVAPGQAEVGNVHFAPNSERDYDWGNPRFVQSYCDDWYDFPNLKRESRQVNATEWGNGNIRDYHMWWLKHIPHVDGMTEGVLNNWWAYVVDPNLVR
jgi:hypothetical protein